MRTEQILLALSIAREKSLTKAAESMNISQPNASNMLKNLEDEIGYRIFQRDKSGVLLTDEGKAFFEQAVNIEQALNLITQPGKSTHQVDFSVLSFQLECTALGFEALCERYDSDRFTGSIRFQIIKNTDEAAKTVANGNADVAVIMCLEKLYNYYRQDLSRESIEIEPVCIRPMELVCRKGHPILRNGKICYDLLPAYPGFSGVPRSSLTPYLSFYDSRLVGQARRTYIMDPGPMRYRLLKKLNGYLFSLPISDEIKETYGLESVPVEGAELTIFAAYRDHSPKAQLIHEYLQLCKDYS